MVGAPDVVQPWMPRAARDRDAWLCHVSIAGGARRRGCAAVGVSVFLDGPLNANRAPVSRGATCLRDGCGSYGTGTAAGLCSKTLVLASSLISTFGVPDAKYVGGSSRPYIDPPTPRFSTVNVRVSKSGSWIV